MMMKNLLFVCAVILFSHTALAQQLSQNFDASTKIKDYVKNKPDKGQFTAITSSGPGVKINIEQGKLRFDRTGNADFGSMARTVELSPIPQKLALKFDISVSKNTAMEAAAALQFGSGFVNENNSLSGTPYENQAAVHSVIGISFGAKEGDFSIRHIGAKQESVVVNGTKTITWVINNSTAPMYYTDPNGQVQNLAADRFDVWINNTLVLGKKGAVSPYQLLKNFKFSFTKGAGIIDLDNIELTDLSN
ncbi:hypothetical protein [Pedobacter hiemivivus]|uniref:Uncharacterized protein n=1 Tax=Pedobacter hiemivivus TaxID=2530454 RepID=A0A4R0MNW1_9SPHI|nr:hypothetical protein [Pedobacter hiemivivus]TCC88475.1 hypothetical protein EZ444_21740 [Pedobacter hiemivivus]